MAAAEELESTYNVAADVYSATSYPLMRREALACERWNLLHPDQECRIPRVAQILPKDGGPVIAVSDFMRAVPDSISRWIESPFASLGTDGFGLSDTRESLRRFFEIDSAAIVSTSLAMLSRDKKVQSADVLNAMKELDIDPDQIDPTER